MYRHVQKAVVNIERDIRLFERHLQKSNPNFHAPAVKWSAAGIPLDSDAQTENAGFVFWRFLWGGTLYMECEVDQIKHANLFTHTRMRRLSDPLSAFNQDALEETGKKRNLYNTPVFVEMFVLHEQHVLMKVLFKNTGQYLQMYSTNQMCQQALATDNAKRNAPRKSSAETMSPSVSRTPRDIRKRMSNNSSWRKGI